MDQGCGKTLEACFMFGSMGEQMMGMAKSRGVIIMFMGLIFLALG
jgi:hypothetical protein